MLIMLHSRNSRFTAGGLHAELEAGEMENHLRLFEHLTSEAHAVAVEVAVVTTAANALNDWRTPIAPGDVARFTPQTATLRALLLVLDNNHLIDGRVSGELLSFIADVDAGREALEAYLDDCESISADRAGLVHARVLRTGWRALALDAKRHIIHLESTWPVPLSELYSQNTRIVSALLSGAGNGLKPCLDEGGRLYVPPLPQRRRAPRRSVLQNCVVHGPAQQLQTGFIRDASMGGLGLGRISGLRRGDHVRVDLANGRQLHGSIAWVTGSSAGLRFDVTLEPSDSLIAI
jgi:hypothetical protein